MAANLILTPHLCYSFLCTFIYTFSTGLPLLIDFVFFVQVTHHFLGSVGSKLLLMLLEDLSTFMSTQRIIMFIETSNQVTSCSMVPSERRLGDLKLFFSCFPASIISVYGLSWKCIFCLCRFQILVLQNWW